MSTVLLVLIVLLVLGAIGGLPMHSWSANWGYSPSISIGLVLLIVVVLLLVGRI
jgi:hypothetical protein